MVQRIFELRPSATSATGYEIVDTGSGKVLDLPEICVEDLDGKYIKSADMLKKIKTMQIALAGVSDSLNMISGDEISYQRRSVLKTFMLHSSGTIDDTITDPIESVKEYETYHTIEMGRDVQGNDGTIHAYLMTPTEGKLRCQFDKSVRLHAKRNNIKYWIDDYKIQAGSKGGMYVIPIGQPVEIL